VKETLFPLIRHALTVGAGFLAGKGFFDAAAADELIAGAMAVIAVIWSYQAKRVKPDPAAVGALALGCMLLFSTGCVRTPKEGQVIPPSQQIDNYIPAIEASAMIGTRKVLKKHPDWKDEFELAAADLEILATAEDLDFLTIMSIVQRLPVKQLQGEDAQLYIEGATVLLAGYGDRLVSLDKLENVSLVAGALAKGIRAGSK
jgi:hypothetical protein